MDFLISKAKQLHLLCDLSSWKVAKKYLPSCHASKEPKYATDVQWDLNWDFKEESQNRTKNSLRCVFLLCYSKNQQKLTGKSLCSTVSIFQEIFRDSTPQWVVFPHSIAKEDVIGFKKSLRGIDLPPLKKLDFLSDTHTANFSGVFPITWDKSSNVDKILARLVRRPLVKDVSEKCYPSQVKNIKCGLMLANDKIIQYIVGKVLQLPRNLHRSIEIELGSLVVIKVDQDGKPVLSQITNR